MSMGMDGQVEMIGFLDAYEAMDPEPELHWDENVGGSHYQWADVIAHAMWHRRMTDFYMKNVMGNYHYD